MNRFYLALASVVAMLVLVAYPTAMGSADESKVVVAVKEGVLQGVNLASWGAGKAETDEKVTHLNRESIRVETRGFHEGARFVLQLPLDLAKFVESPAGAYVDMWVKIAEPKKKAGAGAPGGQMPGMMPGSGPPGMMMPGSGPPGMMMPGGGMSAPMMEPGMMPGGMPGEMSAPMMQPGMMQPGMMQPGMMQPGMMQPGMMQPGMMQPGMMQPGMMEPGMMQPGMMMPGMMQPGMMQPGMMMPGMGEPGMMAPEMMMPGMAEPGMMDPAMMEPGMMMPGMMEEGMLMPGMGQKQEKPARKISKLRVLLVTEEALIDSGAVSAGEELLMNPDLSDEDGWIRVAVPLSDFRPMKTPKPSSLRELAVFGDVEGEIYIDSIRLVQEDQPLKADAGPDRVVKKGQEVSFNAAPQPGDAKARYSWDFDDLVEGIEEDALGQKATYAFEEEGFYAVTLTVTDPDGRRIPRYDRVNVTVQ
jgi:hypothetical protein